VTIRNLEFLPAGGFGGPIWQVNHAVLKLTRALGFETQQGGDRNDGLVRIRLPLQTPAERP